jgi:SUN domain-containing protein 1/2
LIKIAAPLSPTDGPTSSYNGNTDLMTECNSLEQRVTNLEQSLNNRNIDLRLMYTQLQSGRWIEDKILNVIRNWLPAELVLSKDPTTGKVQIPEAFWDGVKDVFVTRSHFSEVVREELRRNVAEGKWESFLAENENRVRCLNSDTNCKLSQRMATFARDEFLYLVATESNAIWTSLEGRVDSLVQRELAQWAEDKIDGGGGGVGGVQGVVSRVEKEILTEIVDRAIEKYHKTHPRHGRHSHSTVSNNAQEQQQPDYALYNSGGRIIPGLTTQPYHRYKPTTLFGRFLGLQNWVPPPFKSDRLMAANKVIQPEMYPGDCWPMHEGRGQVAIDLAMRVVVTEVVIEHVDPMVSLHRGTAPREIEIWRLAAPITSSSSSSSAPSMARDRVEIPILGTWHKPGSPVPGASLLTTITYKQQQPQQQRTGDGKAETRMETGMVIETAQRFAIPLSKQNVPAYGVVIRVLSNWGHPDFACLYRVRVHGRPVQD